MNKCELNLGPFNDCIDMINDGCIAEYPVSQGAITVPINILGLAINNDTPENRKKLKRAIELKVLNMIYEIVNKTNVELQLDRVKIPIASVDFEVDSNERLCITAKLGVAVFDDSPRR